VQCRRMPPSVNERGVEVHKLRIGGKDARKELFKGWVEVEQFTRNAIQGSFCLLKKDMVSAFIYSWRMIDPDFVAG
jgi:serine/threonine-protein kinase Chk1